MEEDIIFSPEELQKLKKWSQQLPQVRGPKEYAPNDSIEQRKQVDSMINEHIDVLREERIIRKGNISIGVWNSENSIVEITQQKGSYWNHFGKNLKGRMTLNVEEALFLMEQGSLELYHGGLPLSLQQAFAMLLPYTFDHDHYLVYTYLMRLGYTVVRHQKRFIKDDNSSKEIKQNTEESDVEANQMATEKETEMSTEEANNEILQNSPVSQLWMDKEGCQPLVRPSNAKCTAAILSKLQIVKTHRMTSKTSNSESQQQTVDFDVYHPCSHFKKSDPGIPPFCVSVCRYSDLSLSLSVINDLTQESHPAPLKLAVTCEGTVSFYDMIDADLPTSIINQ